VSLKQILNGLYAMHEERNESLIKKAAGGGKGRSSPPWF
jgi:hypothetical protein